MLEAIVVLIIDTGVMSVGGLEKYFPPQNKTDIHGTGVAYIATGLQEEDPVCDRVEFVSCDWLKDKTPRNCLLQALNKNYDFINMSLSGSDYDVIEHTLISQLTNSGTVVIVASGNDRLPNIKLSKVYPASYVYDGMQNFRVVGSYDKNSNLGPGVYLEPGWALFPVGKKEMVLQHGTSFAAPRLLKKYLTLLCKERMMFLNNKDNQCRVPTNVQRLPM